MKTNYISTLLCIVALTGFSFVAGCSPAGTDTASTDPTTVTDDGHGHDHPAHVAPHGGFLFDIGRDHAYHGEITDNHDTDVVTIHILDGAVKSHSIDAPSVNLTMTAGDTTKDFDFMASKEGGTSEFTLKDEAMMALLDTKGVKCKVRVTIDDKPFTGAFTYEHGHEHGDHSH